MKQTGEPVQSTTVKSSWEMSAAHNRTAFLSGNGASKTVWDFDNSVQTVWYMEPADTCQCYCQIMAQLQCNLADSLCSYDMLHNAKNMGSATAPNGAPATLWYWSENLGPIPMNELLLFVDPSTNNPIGA